MKTDKYKKRINGIPYAFIDEYKDATTGSKEKENLYLDGIAEFLSDELIKSRQNSKKFNINFNVGIELTESGWVKIKELYLENLKDVFKYLPQCKQEYIDGLEDHFEKHKKTIDDKIYYVDQLWVIMSDYGALFYNGSSYTSSNMILCND